MAKLINIVSVSGTNPYPLEIDNSSGIFLNDQVSDNNGKIYRVSALTDLTHITVTDDVPPDSPHGAPVTGTGSVFTPTFTMGLTQAPFQAPQWDEIIRHDNRVVDDYITDNSNVTAGAGLTGGGALPATLNVAANPDGSIVVNANDVQVGVLASDAQHGARGGGTQHSLATTTLAGFMKPFEALTRRLWVDANTTLLTADQDGSINKPFKTVQQALDVVNAAANGSVYHVSVGFGNYSAETLDFQPNRRLLIEGPIQGATILGNITYNCTGASSTTLALRNMASAVTTIVDSGTPATAANLIFENCRTNGVTTTGTSVVTLNISGTTLASFDFPTLVVASTVNGNLDVVGPIFVTNTLFTASCTAIEGSVLFDAGSSFGAIAFSLSSVDVTFVTSLFRGASTITFTGSAGDVSFDTSSIATFIDNGSTIVNGMNTIKTQRSSGWLSGGVVTRATGFDLNVTAGSGYQFENDDITHYVTWNAGTVTLAPNQLSSVYIDPAGGVISSAPFPVNVRNVIVLAIAQTNGSGIVALSTSYLESTQVVPQFANYVKDVIGPIHVDGLAVTINTNPLRVDVDSGTFYINILPLAATASSPATFTYWYRDGLGGFAHVDLVTDIDPDFYDDGSGTLAALPVGKFKKDLLFTSVHNGNITEYHVVYAQEFHDSQSEAEAGDLPAPSEALTRIAIRCGGIVIESGAAAIASIVDERPRLGQLAGGTTTVSDHGLLSGLADNDHPQYQLVSGKNAANGYAGLDAGTKLSGTQQVYGTAANTATEGNDARVPTQSENDALQGTDGAPSNANRYVTDSDPRNTNARTPTAHAASHLPGGSDALTTAAPGVIQPDDSANAGSALSFSRSDHRHGIVADVPVNVTKAANSEGVSTSFSRADHKHDITTAAPVSLGSANSEGSATSLARSDHVHISPLLQTTFDQVTVNTTTTSTTFVTLLSRVITTGANNIVIHASAGSSNSGDQNTNFFRISVDGVAQRGAACTVRNGLRQGTVAIILKVPVTAASHTVLLEWRVSAGTGSVQPVLTPDAEHASLYIEEVTV